MNRPTRTELKNSTIVEIRSGHPGKSVVIMACIHGNERCGVIACERLLQDLQIKKGRVTIIYANKEALCLNQRQVEHDLNRCFLKEQPDEIAQTLEGETARQLMQYLGRADMLLDIHASYSEQSVPFVICDERNLAIARILPADVVLVNIDVFHPGSTDAYMNLLGRPGLCFECGYLGDDKAVKRAEEALQQFLMYAGVLSENLKERKQRVFKVVALHRNKSAPFKRSRAFADFELFNEKTCVGVEGEEPIFVDAGHVILFARDAATLNEECFLLAKVMQG